MDYWKKGIPYSHIPFIHKKRDDLERYLLKNKIDTERYFDYIIPNLDQYDSSGNYPHAELIANQIINLPINMSLNYKNISKISNLILKFDAKK